MIRHAFTLVWNRKRANALIMLELVVTFLILFALTAFSLHLFRLYDRPLGFDVQDKWSISMTGGGALDAEDMARLRQLLTIAEQFQEVRAVELMSDLPFDLDSNSTLVTIGNMDTQRVGMIPVSSGLPQALGLKLLEGRWFGPQDDTEAAQAEAIVPLIVNRAFSDAVGGDVVGKLMPRGGESQFRIVGVYDDFRVHGQFSAVEPSMLQRMRAEGTRFEAPQIVLILKPGVPADFEERLLGAFQRAAPGWDFDVNTWEALQKTHFRIYTIPLMVGAGLMLFLLAMVGFGMLGVLWQNVIRRTPEMGLRRAMGATAGAVRTQVVLEVLSIAVLALLVGIVIVVQLPLSGVLRVLDWNLFLPSAVLSAAVVLALCSLFALYPSYQATRKEPVEALRYE
jgi:putative ABC transport system permease protein